MMKRICYCAALLLGLAGCAENDGIQVGTGDTGYPISINSIYPTTMVRTRAVIDGGFVASDEMGVFVVDYDNEGNAGEVKMQGNRASNMKFTLQDNGNWTSPAQLYWADRVTPADFYGYYPFDQMMGSATAYSFSVAEKQSAYGNIMSASGYTSSDLLRAIATKVQPTTETVNLQYMHMMAGVKVILSKGTGFTVDEWNRFEKTVLLQNTILSGTVNIVDGTTSVGESAPKPVVPLFHEGTWRAVVFPQKVPAGKNIVSLTVDGQSYTLTNTKGVDFISGKMHQFTIEVDRRAESGSFEFSLVDEAVTAWQDDATLHDGLMRQYIVVESKGAGRLPEAIAALNLDYGEVESMMVKGDINREDMEFMGKQMINLTSLNLSQANIVGTGEDEGLLTGFEDHHILYHFVFPEKGVKKIGNSAFRCSGLKGSLIIPEGVVEIGDYAFNNEWYDEQYFGGLNFDGHVSLTGTLTLPTTLKRIGKSAFSLHRMRGELKLPEGLESIDYDEFRGVFYGSDFSGVLSIPPGMKDVMFNDFPSIHGDIIIPQGVTRIRGLAFADSGYDGILSIPEGVTEIGGGAFRGLAIHGEVRIPSSVTKIGDCAFSGTKISRVIFSENLKTFEGGAFSNCQRLSGELVIPKKVSRIPSSCFENCILLTSIVLHKDVMLIDEKAFQGCNNLNSIICEGEEPPLIVDGAFLGVPKDNFTVEVPKGCVEKYRNARGWSEFKRIAEYSNFVCRPAQAQALNTAHSEELVLNADGAWTAETPSWVTLSKTSGSGKTALTLTFQPLPKGAGKRTGVITFRMDDNTTTCTVNQYDYEEEEDACLKLQTATKGNRGGIDIVFVGDGYDGQNISDGSYLDLVRYQMECFFAVEPYKSMRDYFNVYVTFPLSQERGVNTMYTYVNNRFGTLYGLSSMTSAQNTSTQLLTESDEVMNYVVDKTPVMEDNLWRTLIILVPNSSDYEGHTEYTWDGKTISICPPSEQPYPRDTRGVIQHEAGGHGFGKLGDEMITRNAFAATSIKNEVEDMHYRGWYDNLSTTGKLSSVPWADFIFDPVYSDYVDVFEGGYGFTRGIYRPEVNSCMNYGIPYYNTPSRLSIYKRILNYAGENFSMENFRAQDTFKWGDTEITRSASDRRMEQQYVTGNHHVPMIVDFRKRGVEVRGIRSKLLKNKR